MTAQPCQSCRQHPHAQPSTEPAPAWQHACPDSSPLGWAESGRTSSSASHSLGGRQGQGAVAGSGKAQLFPSHGPQHRGASSRPSRLGGDGVQASPSWSTAGCPPWSRCTLNSGLTGGGGLTLTQCPCSSQRELKPRQESSRGKALGRPRDREGHPNTAGVSAAPTRAFAALLLALPRQHGGSQRQLPGFRKRVPRAGKIKQRVEGTFVLHVHHPRFDFQHPIQFPESY